MKFVIFQALRYRNYRLFWTGNFLSNIGTWMQQLAQGWLVLLLTNSPFYLGLVGFANAAPSLVLTVLGGVVADRFNRRRVLIVTQSVMMLSAALLGALTAAGVVTVNHILLLTFLSGAAMSVNAPVYQSLVPSLVPREDLAKAIGLNSIQFNLSRVIGPTLAGFALALAGVAGCFFINAISFVAILLALIWIKVPSQNIPPQESLLSNLTEGFVYVRRNTVILVLLALIGVSSIFGMPFLILLPVFARDVLHSGPSGLSALMAASGIGAVVGASLIPVWGAREQKGLVVATSAMLFGIGLIAFAQSKIFWLSCVFLVVAGGAMMTFVALSNTIIQTIVREEVRGRVMALYTLAFFGLIPAGSLQAGAIADHFGAPMAVGIGGVVCVLFSVWLAFSLPAIRRRIARETKA